MATVLNYSSAENDLVNHTPVLSFNTTEVIWGYDSLAGLKPGKPTGFDFTPAGGGVSVAGEGQIFPQGQYSFTSDMKQKIVEVDFGGTPTYTKIYNIVDAEVTSGVSIIAVQVGFAATSRPLDENEMDMFNVVACPGIPSDGNLRLYISSRLPVTGKYKFGYTIGTL